MQLIEDIRLIYDNYDFATEILVASIRHPVHVLQSAKIGADVATMPPAVIKSLFNHVLTEKGIAGFLADWEKRSEEHTSELQSLMRTSYAVYCLTKKINPYTRADIEHADLMQHTP